MPSPNAQDPGTDGSADLKGVRVLVVEDSWHVARALQSMFEILAIDVAGPVATTAEAERLIAAQTPDMAVVDINLQGEMAYGLIDSLNDRGVPVIVISGYSILPGLEEKVAAVLHKPFRAAALLTTLRRVAAQNEAQ